MNKKYRRVQYGGSWVGEHVVIAEQVLGKPLPRGAIVHHANGVHDDNRKSNLVICPSKAYHKLLHHRMRAQALGLPLDWRMCGHCKQFDSPENMRARKTRG